MLDFKKEISKLISKELNMEDDLIYSFIQLTKDETNGDYSFPCFSLAKTLRKSPMMIADELKEKINNTDFIEKIESVSGYLNFYIKEVLIREVINSFDEEKEKFGSANIGQDKTVLIDYSSPNIAKPFHIGHLRSTVIGQSLYRIYKELGYNVVGINHLGDYGTQFGKLIEAYKLWHDEYNIDEKPIDELTKMYIRINELCEENPEVLERCRNNFKLLEEKDEYCMNLWNRFKELSLEEFKKTYDLLGTSFDSYKGEAFYSDKTNEVLEILEKNNKITNSEGAKVVDLEQDGINTPCIIQKSNGSSIYATRDLAAILYRARTYDFDKALYVTSYEQVLHFKQVFEVAKLLGLDEKYTKGLEHVSFGMVLLPTGKMSTREGNVIRLDELLKEAISRAKEIIEQKNPELENKEDVAKKVGIGAVIFNDLSASRIKDEVFDWDTILNFQGETGPYIQYTYVRTKSVLEKAEYLPKIEEVKTEMLTDECSQDILKLIYNFQDILVQVTEKNEPSILARYLIDLAKSYSSFYNENKIIVEDKEVQNARVYLTYATSEVLKQGAKLLGIEMPEKM
mgnify:CR=1 FL=1